MWRQAPLVHVLRAQRKSKKPLWKVTSLDRMCALDDVLKLQNTRLATGPGEQGQASKDPFAKCLHTMGNCMCF